MNKRSMLLMLAMLLCFVLLFGVLLRAGPETSSKQAQRISVVLYESGGGRRTSMVLGIRQACTELEIESPIVVMADMNDTARQMSLIEEEMGSGTGGLIVAPVDEALAPFLQTVNESLPLVLVETPLDDKITTVAQDDANLGKTLAQGMVAQESEVVVLYSNMHRQSNLLRYNAFMEEMQRLGIAVEQWEAADGVAKYIETQLAGKPPRAVVAFDTQTLEYAIDAAVAIDAHPRLYGIGSSEKIVYHLDRQLVTETCFVNEFNMGYAAVMKLAGKLGLAALTYPDAIDYTLVNHSNMYNAEVERLLFPIIQ